MGISKTNDTTVWFCRNFRFGRNRTDRTRPRQACPPGWSIIRFGGTTVGEGRPGKKQESMPDGGMFRFCSRWRLPAVESFASGTTPSCFEPRSSKRPISQQHMPNTWTIICSSFGNTPIIAIVICATTMIPVPRARLCWWTPCENLQKNSVQQQQQQPTTTTKQEQIPSGTWLSNLWYPRQGPWSHSPTQTILDLHPSRRLTYSPITNSTRTSSATLSFAEWERQKWWPSEQ